LNFSALCEKAAGETGKRRNRGFAVGLMRGYNSLCDPPP